MSQWLNAFHPDAKQKKTFDNSPGVKQCHFLDALSGVIHRRA
jgi:hypothetical protein